MNAEIFQSIPVDTVEFVSNGGFEQPSLAYTAGAVAVVGGAAIANRYRESRAMAQDPELANYPDTNMRKTVERQALRQRIGAAVTGLAAIAAVSSGIAHEADPYTEESSSRVNEVAAVIGLDYQGYAEDVTEDGQPTSRIEAAVNGINGLDDLDGVDVTFIAAGSEAESMGTISDGSGKAAVVDNFEEYIDDFSHRSDADLNGALNIAESTEAEKILIFNGSVTELASDLRGEAEPDNNRTSVIALGRSGSRVNYIGREREAVLDESGNVNIVGEEDSYSAQTVEEMQEIVSTIVAEQYVDTEEHDYDGFKQLRNMSAGLLAGGLALHAAASGLSKPGSRRQSKRKGDK